MTEEPRSRKSDAGPSLAPSVFCLLSSVVSLVPAGCANNSGSRPPQNDPLLGGAPPVQPGAVPPVAPSAVPAGPTRPGSPSSAAPRSTTSNAALASGGPRPLEGDRDLRIADPQRAWAGQPVAANERGGAILRPPEAGGSAAPRDAMQTPHVIPASGPRPVETGYEQVKARLSARGVVWQQLEQNSQTGEWRFSASVRSRQDPNRNRTYRATAATDVAAMQAVLEEIERENQ